MWLKARVNIKLSLRKKRIYHICLISFFSFSELFPAFDCAKEVGNLQTIWFGFSIFKPESCCFQIILLKSKISLTIPNILSGFSVFISSLDIFSITFFQLLHLNLISSANSLFFFFSFVSYNFFCQNSRCYKIKIIFKRIIFNAI